MSTSLQLRPVALAALAIFSGVSPPTTGQAQPPGTALTIYSSATPGQITPEMTRSTGRMALPGYAVIRQERDLDFTRGRNAVRFADVAAFIDPTTVVFESLSDPKGTTVLEQNFQFDLVSTDKLMQKYIDRPVTIDQIRGQSTESFSGTLLSTQGGIVLKRDDGTVQILPHNAGARLPSLPGGLITRPTLVWDVSAAKPGQHRTRVSYQTQGMTWWADYNLTYSEGASANACHLDVGAWVSIVNQSGAGYSDAKLKLVAGDVNRVRADNIYPASLAGKSVAREEKANGFAEKSFFEYHLYTLGRPTTLPDNSTKQIELFPVARRVPCERILVYYGVVPGQWRFFPSPQTDRNYGVQGNRKVDVYLQFRNSESNNMGMPLPAGRMRVSKLDPADQTLEFVGEDAITHTPRNEKVLLQLGSAFDVVGERRQLDFRVDSSRNTMTEEIEVKLRNQKKERVVVQVKENLYRWLNWEITRRSHDFQKEDARTITFPVTIAPGEEAVVRYTVRYSW
jgi:hypothetical protein